MAGRDRLRELLDAVLDEDNARLEDMAGDAYASQWHFSRQFAAGTGESPVALRRRVMLERAAWRLGAGARVTDVAIEAGYDSTDGFARAYARAYGFPPSSTTPGGATAHWLDAPNGVHFHPPTNLWVSEHAKEPLGMQLTAHLVHHDVDDTRHLLEVAATMDDADYRRKVEPGRTVLSFDGPEESVADVLHRLVSTKEIWLAAIDGEDFPDKGDDSPAALLARLDVVGARWIDMVRSVEQRDGWGDRIVDALCDPPESFPLGGIVAHVITYSAHRRQAARQLMRAVGQDVDPGDPISWLRERD